MPSSIMPLAPTLTPSPPPPSPPDPFALPPAEVESPSTTTPIWQIVQPLFLSYRSCRNGHATRDQRHFHP